MSRAHGRLVGQPLDAKWLGEPFAHPVHQPGEPPVHAAHIEQRRELGLAARPALVDHQLLGCLLGDRAAQVVLDQRQRQVDAGGDAGRGPDLPLAHEDPIGLHPDPRIAPSEVVGAAPMRRRPLAVQQARFGQQIGAGADAGGPPDPRRAVLQPFHRSRQARQVPRSITAGDHDRVVRRLVERLGEQPHAGRARHRASARRQHLQRIGAARNAAGDLEGRYGACRVQNLEIREDKDADLACHGRFRGKIVISAAR